MYPEPEERVYRTIRKHWFIIVIHLLRVALGYLLPIAGYSILAGNTFSLPPLLAAALPLPGAWETLLLAAWTAVWWSVAFAVWTDYYLDTWQVTQRRIIDTEQRGFFSREVSSFRLDRIQDVTTEVSGIIPTLLDYGVVHVQTAGENRRFTLPDAPHPAELKEYVLAQHHRAAETRPSRDAVNG